MGKQIAFPISHILLLHVCSCLFMFVVSSIVCLFWYRVCQYGDTEEYFKTSETLQLLQIVIGFTYINVIQSFFHNLESKSSIVAEMRVLYDNQTDYRFIQRLVHHNGIPNDEQDSWDYWEQLGISLKWKPLFTKIIVQNEKDSGELFKMLGPYTALAVFYFFHPPVAWSDDASTSAWFLIYCTSVVILFSFLLTMYIIERPVSNSFWGKLVKPCTMQAYMERATRHFEKNETYRNRRIPALNQSKGVLF